MLVSGMCTFCPGTLWRSFSMCEAVGRSALFLWMWLLLLMYSFGQDNIFFIDEKSTNRRAIWRLH